MYTYIKAFLIGRDPTSVWEERDIADIPLRDVYRESQQFRVVLDHTMAPGIRTADFMQFANELAMSDMTIVEWLASIGNRAIVATPGEPTQKTLKVRTYSTSQADIALFLTDRVSPMDSPRNPSKTSLFFKPPKGTPRQFYENCLVSVGGYLHFVDYSTDGLYVVDGAKHRNSPSRTASIHSFQELGGIRTYPVNSSMVQPFIKDGSLKDGFVIKLPESLGEYEVLLSLAGNLLLNDRKIMKRLSDDLIFVDWPRFNWRERFIEMSKFLDLSELPIARSETSPTKFSNEDINRDEVIKALLDMTQTFAVRINRKELAIGFSSLRKSGGPNVYLQGHSHGYPDSILMGGIGRILDYWVEQAPFVNVIRTSDARQQMFEHSFADTENLDIHDDAGVGGFPGVPDYKGHVHLITLSSTELQMP